MPASSYASSGSPRIPIDAQLSTADTPSRLITSTSIAEFVADVQPLADERRLGVVDELGRRLAHHALDLPHPLEHRLLRQRHAARVDHQRRRRAALAPPRARIGFASSDAVRGEPVSVCAEMGIVDECSGS